MTREELEDWHNDWENEKLSSGAYILYLRLFISDFESRTCSNCKLGQRTEASYIECNKWRHIRVDTYGCTDWEAKDE